MSDAERQAKRAQAEQELAGLRDRLSKHTETEETNHG